MRSKIHLALLALLGTLLLAGIIHLFQIRFAAGDTYPPYSSLRADPLGARALYEAFNRLPGLQAERAFVPLQELSAGPETTLFVIGLTPNAIFQHGRGTNLVSQALSLAEDGSRVVIGFSPYPAWSAGRSSRRPTCAEEEDSSEEDSSDEAATANEAAEICLDGTPAAPPPTADPDCCSGKRHQVRTNLLATAGLLLVRADPETAASRAHLQDAAPEALPAEIPCRSNWNLIPRHEAWQVIYHRDGQPVVLERKAAQGRGSVVLAGDSFALGNEALWRDRSTPYLVWLLGNSRRAVFLESHHGLREQVGIMLLIRRFRLQGVLAGLALLAALFIWQQQAATDRGQRAATSRHGTGDGAIAGRDVYSGLTSLLKRAVPPRQLNETCVALWRAAQRSHDRRAAATGHRLSLLLEQSGTGNTPPVRQYQDLCRLLQERKKT